MALVMKMAAHTVVSKWILDYIAHHLWEEFKENKNVKDQERDLIEGIIDLVHPIKHLNDTDLRTNLLMLPCFLVDGEDYNRQYSNNAEDLTVLERTLHIFLNIVDNIAFKTKHYQEVITAFKRQAVVVCCQNKDFNTAQNVYDRLWGQQKTKEAHLLLKVIEDENISHEYITSHPYSDFLDQVIVAMETFHKHLAAPFLVKVAETDLTLDKDCVNKVIAKVMNGNQAESGDISFRPNNLKEAAKAMGENQWQPYSSKEANKKLHAKLHEIREKTKADKEKDVLGSIMNPHVGMESDQDTSATENRTSFVDDPVEEVIYESREARHNLDVARDRIAKHYRRNRNRENRHNPVDIDVTANGHADLSSGIYRPTNQVVRTQPRRTRRSRRSNVPWTGIEERKLIAGVDKYGKGQWSKILKEFIFPGRTGINLKDKWRTLTSQGHVK